MSEGPGSLSSARQSRLQRAKIWQALIRICARLESLQTTPEGRQACREIVEQLKQSRRTERKPGNRSRA